MTWAIWIAYAPLMGIFFAMIAYGRTVSNFAHQLDLAGRLLGLVWFALGLGRPPLDLAWRSSAVLTS
mgnify:CR=1 FL=1